MISIMKSTSLLHDDGEAYFVRVIGYMIIAVGVVSGAGTTELILAGVVRDHSAGLDGREQLVVSSFGDALEGIPRTLVSTAWLDPAAVKQGAIRTAAEAAVMIVRIDDVISAE